jgi:hypothetical protein
MVVKIMKKYKIPFLLLSIALISSLYCGNNEDKTIITPGKDVKSEKNNMGIILTQDTALRIDPLIFSARITQMNKGQIVEVLDRSSEEKIIAGSADYWYKIKLENRITGWTFGKHIKILDSSGKEAVDSYLGKFWEKETEELSKELHGKWWSINRYGDFTNHALEIHKDGQYRSYSKGGGKPVEGVYNFDFNKNMVIFLSGTTFKNDLHYTKKGNIYSLSIETDKDEIRFKKININPSSDVEEVQNNNEEQKTGNQEDES